FRFEMRALLNVQLDKLVPASRRLRHGFKLSRESGLRAQLFQAAVFLVAQSQSLLRREHIGHHAAAEAPDSEAGWLLGGENDQLDGAARLEAKLLEHANGLQSAQHAHAAVIQTGIRNGVNMRAGAD